MTGRARELQDTIIERTAQKLEHVFGMAFHELPEKKGQYILVNKLFQTKEYTHIEMLPKVSDEYSLIFHRTGHIRISVSYTSSDKITNYITFIG